MNFFRLENGEDFVEINITGYEFEECNEDWLMVYGTVKVDGVTIKGADPTLEVGDMPGLKKWAQAMLEDRKTDSWFPIEPNFEIAYTEDEDELSVYFYPEREGYETDTKIPQLTFVKKCEDKDFEAVIKWCDEVIKEFKSRG